MSPGYAFAWGQLVLFHRRHQRHQHERAAAEALVRATTQASACAALADACLSMGDSAGAIEACQRAVALDPEHAPTWFAWSICSSTRATRPAPALRWRGSPLTSRRTRSPRGGCGSPS